LRIPGQGFSRLRIPGQGFPGQGFPRLRIPRLEFPGLRLSHLKLTGRAAMIPLARTRPTITRTTVTITRTRTKTTITITVTVTVTRTKTTITRSTAVGFPAERDWVEDMFHVDLVPEREHDQRPHLAPGHVRVSAAEPACHVQRAPLVQPLLGGRLADDVLGKARELVVEPFAHRHGEAQGRAFRGFLRQQAADRLPERELRRARRRLLRAGQPGGDRHHLAVEERRAQLKAVGHRRPVGLDQDVPGQPRVDVH
jgi:hypothetical protein